MECFAILFSFILKNNDVRLPKNVYQLFEFSGGISSLDSKHGTKRKINENQQKIEFSDVNISKIEFCHNILIYFNKYSC